MDDDSAKITIPRIFTLGFLIIGGYLFGLSLIASCLISSEWIPVQTVRMLLSIAGWFLMFGWLMERYQASSKRFSWFRLFRWLGRLDRTYDRITATTGGRLCLGAVTGFGILVLLRFAF